MQTLTQYKSQGSMILCLCLPIIFLAEFLLFKKYVAYNITSFYPSSFDQASYLPILYLTLENIKQYGLIEGVLKSPSLATGVLFPIQSAVAFLIWGASRYTVLLVNFIYFILLQLSCVFAVRSITKNNYIACAFLGVLLAIKTPFVTGGVFDVRMDFISLCLYGIFINFTICSEFYLNRKWSIAAALVACLTILSRTITLVYFIGVLTTFAAYLFINRKDNKQRISNILLIFSILLITVVPLVWFNHEVLYQYYFLSHMVGEEKNIRLTLEGVTSLVSGLLFYPKSLLYHFGLISQLLCVAVLLNFFMLHIMHSWQPNNRSNLWRMGTIFLLLAISLPMLVLTIDISKSPVVASILVVPSIWLVFWYGCQLSNHIEISTYYQQVLKISACLVLLIGVYVECKALRYQHNQTQINELTAITQLYMGIGDYVAAKGQAHTSIAFDNITEYMTSGSIATVYYENSGKLLDLNVERLGGSILPITKEEALESLKRANIFVLKLGEYTVYPPYPYNQSVLEFRPLLKEYAEQHFKVLGDYKIQDSTYRVYVSKNA